MRWFRIVKSVGLLLFGLSELVGIIVIWVHTPPLPSGVSDIGGQYEPLSTRWYWFVGISVVLLAASVVVSSHRMRQMAFICLALTGLVAVPWIRSYQTQYQCITGRTYLLPDGREGRSVWIFSGNGGILIAYHKNISWYRPGRPKPESPGFTVLNIGFARSSREYADKSSHGFYPGMHSDLQVWKGGWLDRMGIRFWAREVTGTKVQDTYMRGVTLPYWVIVLPLQLFPILWLIQLARYWRRKREGFCFKCGYDLRASIEKCPECGTPIPSRKVAASADVPSPAK
jgi:hypothetical protein